METCLSMGNDISVNGELRPYLNRQIKCLNCLTTLKSASADRAPDTYLLLASAGSSKADWVTTKVSTGKPRPL